MTTRQNARCDWAQSVGRDLRSGLTSAERQDSIKRYSRKAALLMQIVWMGKDGVRSEG